MTLFAKRLGAALTLLVVLTAADAVGHAAPRTRQDPRVDAQTGRDVRVWPPDVLFDRAWALELFADALNELEREYTSGARRGPFEVVRELFQFGAAPPYAELAVRHDMSVPQLKAFVHRARLRFRELLRQRVADTLTDERDADDELSALLGALAA